MFCCESLAGLVSNAGKKGFGVVPYSSHSAKSFRIQARACDAADMPPGGIRELLPAGRLALVMETGLRHCPNCGANLAEWIKTNESHFQDLLSELGKFVLSKW